MIDRLQQGTQASVTVMCRSSDAIAGLIGAINAMNAQIASAAEEQAAVAEEINRSMQQIAVTVDSVADETRHGAATARSLSGQGSLVRQFRI